MATNENLPKPAGQNNGQGEASGDGNGNGNTVNVNNLHLHGNDIRELTKLAEVNPKLAEKLIDQKERQSIREESSFKFGLVAALIFVVCLIFGVVHVVVNAGVVALILTVAVILAVALLLRVILTGEWSDTSWIGKLLEGGVSLLGGKMPKDDD